MDIQALTPAIPVTTTLAQVPVPAPAATYQDVASTVPAPVATSAYDVSALNGLTSQAVVQTDTTPDLQAEDVALQAERVLQSQQTVLAALKSGGMDASVLLSGLPPGATATLLGGGWVQPLPGQDPATIEALWAFHLPYRQDVPAVTSSTRTAPASDQEKHAMEGKVPLTGYGPQGEKEPVENLPGESTLDILD